MLKHALWAARDVSELAGADTEPIRRAFGGVRDAEGRVVGALARFGELRTELGDRPEVAAFEAALTRAVAAAAAGAPDSVARTLALGPAFDALRAALVARE